MFSPDHDLSTEVFIEAVEQKILEIDKFQMSKIY